MNKVSKKEEIVRRLIGIVAGLLFIVSAVNVVMLWSMF